jgi:hypothetical protein
MSSVTKHTALEFNVADYGAVGDNKRDNTAVFTECLNDIITAGGGRMYLPAGVYRGKVVIPKVEPPDWINIEITGERQPAALFGTIGENELPAKGSIIKTIIINGNLL